VFSRGLSTTVLTVVALTSMIAVTGCASAQDAKPVTKDFPFTGHTLNVRAHGAPTDLVASNRSDVLVTRWFDVRTGARPTTSWTLRDGTLDLSASCTGLANCDVRFRVEIPASVRVLRNGKPTKLHGAAPATGK